MAGNEHIPTAPKDVIGDDGDLRTMRDALRNGKYVVLAQDGHVYVSQDAGTPMSEAQESFIESKLSHVIELARSGYGVGVRPDGTIVAERADRLSKVMYDPDPALSEDQRLLIRKGVAEGALVRVHGDGRVEYFLAKDTPRPPAGQVSRLLAAIDAEIASGRLLSEMGNGRSLSANPDGSLDYRTVAPGPEPVLFPEDRQLLDTVAEFDAEAEALELGAGAARIDGLEDFLRAERAAIAGRDAAGRERAAAEGAAGEAQRQVDAARQRGNEAAAAELDAWRKADAARAAGDTALAQEVTESAQAFAAMKINARLEEEAAQEALATHRATAARHAADEDRLDGQVTQVKRRAKELEDVFDAQEDQAKDYRTAAAELREAERLEAALADLEARGVAGVERIRAAAAEHRRLATEAAARGSARDQAAAATPGTTPPAAPAPVAPDPTPASPTGPRFRPPSPIADDVGALMDATQATDQNLLAASVPGFEPDPVGTEDAGLHEIVAAFDGSGPDETVPEAASELELDAPAVDAASADAVATVAPEVESELGAPAIDLLDVAAADPVAAAEIEMPALDLSAEGDPAQPPLDDGTDVAEFGTDPAV